MIKRTSQDSSGSTSGITRRTFAAGVGAAGTFVGVNPFAIARAQGAPLKVGILLPRAGHQAGIGQDCHRGVEIATSILKARGLPALELINGDTESSPDVARARA